MIKSIPKVNTKNMNLDMAKLDRPRQAIPIPFFLSLRFATVPLRVVPRSQSLLRLNFGGIAAWGREGLTALVVGA